MSPRRPLPARQGLRFLLGVFFARGVIHRSKAGGRKNLLWEERAPPFARASKAPSAATDATGIHRRRRRPAAAPPRPPPPRSVPERRSGEDPSLPPDVRGSSLRLANALYPDAASLRPARLVCVCGTGCAATDATLPQRLRDLARGRARFADARDEWLAAVSYEATCGRRAATGDGVTPRESALLPGARHVLLPGVWHLPGARPWYGSEAVVPLWSAYLAPVAPDPAPSRR